MRFVSYWRDALKNQNNYTTKWVSIPPCFLLGSAGSWPLYSFCFCFGLKLLVCLVACIAFMGLGLIARNWTGNSLLRDDLLPSGILGICSGFIYGVLLAGLLVWQNLTLLEIAFYCLIPMMAMMTILVIIKIAFYIRAFVLAKRNYQTDCQYINTIHTEVNTTMVKTSQITNLLLKLKLPKLVTSIILSYQPSDHLTPFALRTYNPIMANYYLNFSRLESGLNSLLREPEFYIKKFNDLIGKCRVVFPKPGFTWNPAWCKDMKKENVVAILKGDVATILKDPRWPIRPALTPSEHKSNNSLTICKKIISEGRVYFSLSMAYKYLIPRQNEGPSTFSEPVVTGLRLMFQDQIVDMKEDNIAQILFEENDSKSLSATP